jgi:hypothetical protein
MAQKSLLAKEITAKADSISKEKFCTSCHRHKPSLGGKWISKLKGSQKRWICAICFETRKVNLT